MDYSVRPKRETDYWEVANLCVRLQSQDGDGVTSTFAPVLSLYPKGTLGYVCEHYGPLVTAVSHTKTD